MMTDEDSCEEGDLVGGSASRSGEVDAGVGVDRREGRRGGAVLFGLSLVVAADFFLPLVLLALGWLAAAPPVLEPDALRREGCAVVFLVGLRVDLCLPGSRKVESSWEGDGSVSEGMSNSDVRFWRLRRSFCRFVGMSWAWSSWVVSFAGGFCDLGLAFFVGAGDGFAGDVGALLLLIGGAMISSSSSKLFITCPSFAGATDCGKDTDGLFVVARAWETAGLFGEVDGTSS
jgi:hypothetical protein